MFTVLPLWWYLTHRMVWCQAEYRQYFREYDKDGSGELSIGELAAVMTTMNEVLSVDDLNAMIDVVDDNKNGTVEVRRTNPRQPCCLVSSCVLTLKLCVSVSRICSVDGHDARPETHF